MEQRFTKPKKWLWGQFENARGKTLRYGSLSTHKTPLAHIVFVEGLSEPAEKTFELARDFNKKSCNFSVLDRYGQGKSERYFTSAPQKQHSQNVDKDIDDLIQYCRDHIPAGEPIVLLGHSTGGMIALKALEKDPELFKAAVLTAPLMGIKVPVITGQEAAVAALPLPRILLNKYIPGGSDWTARDAPASVHKADEFSSDPVRNKISDYWPDKDEALRAGNPTVGWVREMCRAITKIRDPKFLAKVQNPVLVFTGGQDILVENKFTDLVAGQLPDCQAHHYENGKHELLMETDDIRGDILGKTIDFIKNKL